MQRYDLAVVGAGIVGLAHALAAARRGQRVVVIERDAAANGASIRNFGFVTVTGQAAGDVWQLARRSAAIWAEVATASAIPIVQRGLLLTARRPEAEAALDAFLATAERIEASAAMLRAAGAHIVIDTVADLSDALRQLSLSTTAFA